MFSDIYPATCSPNAYGCLVDEAQRETMRNTGRFIVVMAKNPARLRDDYAMSVWNPSVETRSKLTAHRVAKFILTG